MMLLGTRLRRAAKLTKDAMISAPGLAALLQTVLSEWDVERALQRVCSTALAVTKSRNGLVALLDDEDGVVAIRHGVGHDWSPAHNQERLQLGVGARTGIVGYVAATGNSVVSGEVRKDDRYVPLFESTRSEIAVPIRDEEGRVRGVLNVESNRSNHYNQDHIRLCEMLADLCSLIINRDERLQHEQALSDIARALGTELREERLVERVLEVTGRVLHTPACSIFLREDDGARLVLRGSTGVLRLSAQEVAYYEDQGLTGWVAHSGQSVLLAEPQKDPRWRGLHLELPADQIESFVAAPIRWKGRSIGVIRALRQKSENPYFHNVFRQADLKLLEAIAQQVAVGLHNIRTMERRVNTERMAAWGEMSARSSHMIGNRVFAIKGHVNDLEYWLSQPKLDRDELMQVFGRLDSGVRRIDEILQDFRDFVTAVRVEPVPVDLNDLVTTSARDAFPTHANATLRFDLEPNLPPALADPNRFTRAMAELVENALHHTSQGTVTVRTGQMDGDLAAERGCNPGRAYLWVEVEDDGPGVPAELKESIFEPFFTSRVQGMGLGLPIVKGVLEAHGGTVLEEGLPGQGARFVMLLPSAKRP